VPPNDNPLPRTGWLTDRIVSVEHGTEYSFRHEGRGPRSDTKDPYLSLHFVNIYVRDQERSKKFFLEQIGFNLVADVRFESGNRWVEVAPPDGTAVLALVVPTAGSDEEGMVGHSGMITFITEDFESKYREWSERGVKFSIPPQSPAWGGVFSRFEDVDGNPFVLAGFDDVTRAIEERRRAAAERLEEERRAAQELEIAKQVQARLFPQTLPLIPGLDYAGICLQARAVGGDYYDFLDLGGERVALVIGDIAGKGIAAALLMANLQACLRSHSTLAADQLDKFLLSVNRLLFENTAPHAYATLLYAEYDPAVHRLRSANCGHLPGLLLRANGTLEHLHAECTVVGMFDDWQCATSETELYPDDVLVFYTDGVIEAFDDHGEEFGEERLIDVLRRHRGLPAQELAGVIVDQVQTFSAREQYDDITLIIAKRVYGLAVSHK
jgi:serine phosphatase RsbU (regulator of sigma subunit)/predicted enzyme related to lactoylglutathione lyase